MIIKPEKYFQYTIPNTHTLLNGWVRDFRDKSAVGYKHFESTYMGNTLVVMISDEVQKKLEDYYINATKENVPLLHSTRIGRWYANGFISAYNYCEQYEREHPSAKVNFASYADNLELLNEEKFTHSDKPDPKCIVNVGRIEGVRFYLAEKTVEEPRNLESRPKSNNPSGRPVGSFESLLNGTDLKREKTRAKLKELIKGKRCRQIALVITCAMDSGLMTKPTYSQLKSEYVPEGKDPTETIGSENSIQKKIGKNNFDYTEYNAMKSNFDELRMMH